MRSIVKQVLIFQYTTPFMTKSTAFDSMCGCAMVHAGKSRPILGQSSALATCHPHLSTTGVLFQASQHIDEEHKKKCGGTFEKVAEPEGYKAKKPPVKEQDKIDQYIKKIDKKRPAEEEIKEKKQSEKKKIEEDLEIQLALLDFLNLK